MLEQYQKSASQTFFSLYDAFKEMLPKRVLALLQKHAMLVCFISVAHTFYSKLNADPDQIKRTLVYCTSDVKQPLDAVLKFLQATAFDDI